MPPRTVIREHRFDEELRRIEPDARRADAFVEAAEWALSRDPEQGIPVRPSSPIRLLFQMELPDSPPLALYYRFDDQYVYLLSIVISPQGFG